MTDYNSSGFRGWSEREVQSESAGSLPIWDGDGNAAVLPAGAEGEVLIIDSNGVPSWTAQPSLVLIEEQTLSSANTTVTFSNIPNTYRYFKLVGEFVKSSSDITSILLRFNGDTTGANYQSGWMGFASDNTFVSSTSTSAAGVSLLNIFNINSSSIYSFAEVEIYQFAANQAKGVKSNVVNSSQAMQQGFGQWENTSNAISSIEIVANQQFAGTVTKWRLYGVG